MGRWQRLDRRMSALHIAALTLFAGAGALAIWSIIYTLKGN
jgi:hypothetical protein